MSDLELLIRLCKGQVTVTVNGHWGCYTVKNYFAYLRSLELVEDCDRDAIQRYITADTVWEIQAYPATPVGFITAYGATLQEALDPLLMTLGAREGAA